MRREPTIISETVEGFRIVLDMYLELMPHDPKKYSTAILGLLRSHIAGVFEFIEYTGYY